nr:uncharacterized protein LOC129281971 [Lytechinus pictus]
MNRKDRVKMFTCKYCKRSTWVMIFLVIFLSVIIVSSQAMTISRDELSQLFDGFLDKIEQRSDENSAEVKESPRQIPQIGDDAEENRSKLSQKLASILHELNEEESDSDTVTRPSMSDHEQDQNADAVLMELLNEGRNSMAYHQNETTENDDSHDDNDVAGDANENASGMYDFATCELRLNERLEPMTLAKYHGLRGTVNFRQNRSNGSLEVLIRLFGLIPSNINSQGHGVYIREFGDLRDGCHRLGPILNSDSENDSNRSSGMLAVISPDGSGYAQYKSTEVAHFDLAGSNSLYGRSIVIEENQNTFSAPLGCCVIGVTRDVGDWM